MLRAFFGIFLLVGCFDSPEDQSLDLADAGVIQQEVVVRNCSQVDHKEYKCRVHNDHCHCKPRGNNH